MLKFVQENPVTTALIVIIIIALIVYLIKFRKGLLQKVALYAVARAEAEWTSGTGKIKFAEAYTYIKQTHPILTFFISEEKLSEIIEKALDNLKEVIANDKDGNPVLKNTNLSEEYLDALLEKMNSK